MSSFNTTMLAMLTILNTLIASGMKTPKQIAASTSVGQCTPNTRRDSAIRLTQPTAKGRVTNRDFGHICAAPITTAVENAAVLSVWPLGKLDPQYHAVVHSSGRARPMVDFNA